MAKSLADQLLNAGMVDQKKAKQIEKEKKKRQKQKLKNKLPEIDEAKLAAQRALTAKQNKSRQLNQQRESISRVRAIDAQIKQLVEKYAVKAEGDNAFNFADQGKIKKIHIDDQSRTGLIRGYLGIVKHDATYRLVPSAIADKIAERDASRVLLQNQKADTDEEDAYADFKIPDDLMW